MSIRTHNAVTRWLERTADSSLLRAGATPEVEDALPTTVPDEEPPTTPEPGMETPAEGEEGTAATPVDSGFAVSTGALTAAAAAIAALAM